MHATINAAALGELNQEQLIANKMLIMELYHHNHGGYTWLSGHDATTTVNYTVLSERGAGS